MGGVIKSVFGGSSSKQQSQQTQESGNHAYDAVVDALGPLMNSVPKVGSAISSLLGLDGGSGQSDAFNQWKDSTGYDFTRDEGIKGVQQGMSGAGTFDSGATGKGLAKYTTGLADNTFNTYMQQLMGLGNAGLGAATQVGDAGKYSYGQSTSQGNSSSYTGGLGKALGFGIGNIGG